MGRIPDRWQPYSPMGGIIPGTRFMACKVPLKDELLRSLPENERFGPKDLLKAFPKTRMLVDLTNTTRYYFKEDFTNNDIRYEKIFCPGKVVPPNSIIKKFFNIIDDHLASEKDPAVIAVHCTHGVNRTGYFICRYMIERLNMLPEEALKNFQTARGHDIERDNYVDDLKNGCKGGSEADLRFVQNFGFGRDRGRNGGPEHQRRRRFREHRKRVHHNDANQCDVYPEKRLMNEYQDIAHVDQYNGGWNDTKRNHSFPRNYDRKPNPEGDKFSYNWRDKAVNPNSSPLKTPLPQFTPGHPQQTNHEVYTRSLDPPARPGMSYDGARYRGRGRDKGPPPRTFREGRDMQFQPLPKFYQDNTSSRLVGDCVSGPHGSDYAPVRHRGFEGQWRGSRGGGGGGRGRRGRGGRGGPRSWSRGSNHSAR